MTVEQEFRNQPTAEQPQPTEIIPLTPKIKILRGLTPKVHPGTGEKEGFAQRLLGHRADLHFPENKNPEEYRSARKEKTAYVYRRGLKGEATLMENVFGSSLTPTYKVETRALKEDPTLLKSFVKGTLFNRKEKTNDNAEFFLVNFEQTVETPPQKLPLERFIKPQLSRPLDPLLPSKEQVK